MPGVVADSVIVSIESRFQQYERDFDRLIQKTETGMAKLRRLTEKPVTVGASSSGNAEREAATVERTSTRKVNAARKEAETEEQKARRISAAVDKGIAARERDAQSAERNADRVQRAGNRSTVVNQTRLMSGTSLSAVNPAPVAQDNVNYLIRDQIDLRAKLGAAIAAGEAKAITALNDELTLLRLISQYKRAGLSDTDAAVRAEQGLAAVVKARANTEANAALEQQANVAKGVAGTGRIANGYRNLGRQIADVGVGVAGGMNPFLIIAQQAPQVADALTDTGGKAAKVASFFAGPWGAALLAAGSVAAILGSRLLETGENLESLVKKLEDDAEKARLSAEAHTIFERSLYGAADASASLSKRLQEQNRSQIQVAQSALAAAQALRQQNLQNLRGEQSKATVAANNANNAETAARASDDPAASIAAQTFARNAAAARQRLAVANKALADSEKAVVEASVPILKLQAADQADKSVASTSRHERAVNKLTDAYRAAQAAAAKLGGAAGNAARAEAVRTYREGVAQANRDYAASGSSSKASRGGGASRATTGTASSNFNRQTRDDEAFSNENEQLRQQQIDALRAQTTDIATLAQYTRDDIASATRKRLAQIDADEATGKYSKAQAEENRALARGVALLETVNVNLDERAKLQAENNGKMRALLANQSDELQASLQGVENRKLRNAIEDKIIKLKYDQLRKEQDDIINSVDPRTTFAERIAAGERKQVVNAQEQGDNRQNALDRKSPYQRYRDNLNSADSLSDEIDGIKIEVLDRVADSLADATKNALGLTGALGDVVGQIIKIGIQRRLIGPLADALFGKADGSSGGGLGAIFGGGSQGNPSGVLSLLGGLFGGARASGGDVSAGRLYRINENGPEFFQPAMSGKIIPTGRARDAGSGGVTVVQHISVDGRNSVTPASFASDILGRANQYANQAAAKAGQSAYQASPQRSRDYQQQRG